MRIAIISDIHANLEAFKTTLQDIRSRNIDKIFCLGDTIQKGCHAEECVNLLRENCDVVVKGNCDIDFDNVYTESAHNIPAELMNKRVEWVNKLLSEESKNYLRNLPFSFEFYMSGSLVRIFHAHPKSLTKVIINEDSYETKYELFEPSEHTMSQKIADIIIFGHLHAPFMNKLYNKTLINVGSVGNSFNVVRDEKKDSNVLETTSIHYLIVEGDYGVQNYGGNLSFDFVRLPYNIDKELEDLAKNLEPEAYKKELKEGIYRNMSKIEEKQEELRRKRMN